jgi:hypothetical protein
MILWDYTNDLIDTKAILIIINTKFDLYPLIGGENT